MRTPVALDPLFFIFLNPTKTFIRVFSEEPIEWDMFKRTNGNDPSPKLK